MAEPKSVATCLTTRTGSRRGQVSADAVQSYASDTSGSDKSVRPIFLYTLSDGDRANAWDS